MSFPGLRRLFLLAVVGLSGLCVEPAVAQPSTGTQIAALKKRLEALPRHAARRAKIESLAGELTRLSPRRAPVWLETALEKIAAPNAILTGTALTNQLSKIVKQSRLSGPEQRRVIAQNNGVLKRYKPPGGGIPF